MAARYLIRLTNNDRILNRHDNRPIGIASQLLVTGEASRPQTVQQTIDTLRDKTDPVFSFSATDASPAVLQSLDEASHYMDEDAYLETLGRLIRQAAGITESSWNEGIAVDASGVARERSQDLAAARIRGVRRDLVKCLPLLLKGLGCPRGKVMFSWLNEPFEDKTMKQTNLLALLAAGVVTPQFVQRNLGIEEHDVETQEEEPTEEEDDDQPVRTGN